MSKKQVESRSDFPDEARCFYPATIVYVHWRVNSGTKICCGRARLTCHGIQCVVVTCSKTWAWTYSVLSDSGLLNLVSLAWLMYNQCKREKRIQKSGIVNRLEVYHDRRFFQNYLDPEQI